MLGGDSGVVVVANHPSRSSLYNRVIFIEDSEHMPPKGDPFLSIKKLFANGSHRFGLW